MFLANDTDTAYALATQLVGSAFIARRSMVDVEARVLADSVFADAAVALQRIIKEQSDPASGVHLTMVASIIQALRMQLPATLSAKDNTAA
jgi:hypothetical protein